MSRSAVAAKVLHAPGVASLARGLGTWTGLVVLAYHRIAGERPDGPDGGVTGTTQEGLDSQLAFLTKHADVVAPDDLPAVLTARGRHLLMTFDDGYRDNYQLAYPVLRARGVRAAFFLTTGFLDHPRLSWWDELGWMVAGGHPEALPAGEWLTRPLRLDDHTAAVRALTTVYKRLPGERTVAFMDWCGEAAGTGRAGEDLAEGVWMTWEMAREMRAGGMTLGGHTQTHPVLARLTREKQEEEIAGCERRLADELGQRMRLFSYPVGLRDSFDRRTREILAGRGVDVAFSCYGGHQTPRDFDPLDVRRATAGASSDLARLNAMLISPRHFARW